jgi:hypothetical protein
VLRCPSRLCCVIVSSCYALMDVLLVLVRFGEVVDGWMDGWTYCVRGSGLLKGLQLHL